MSSSVSIVSGIPHHSAPALTASLHETEAKSNAPINVPDVDFKTAKVSVIVTAKCGCICEFIKVGFGGNHSQIVTCRDHAGRIGDIERTAVASAKSVLSSWAKK